jgi:hypothetical protein
LRRRKRNAQRFLSVGTLIESLAAVLIAAGSGAAGTEET